MQVELHIRTKYASVSTPQYLLDERDGVGSSQPSPLPQYNIVRDKEKRQVIPPKRYAEDNLVAYALYVAESIDTCQIFYL